MDMDEDDDFYASEEAGEASAEPKAKETPQPVVKAAPENDLESGEEEDEADSGDSDSDMEIITERKDGDQSATSQPQKYNEIRNIPQRTGAAEGTTTKLPAVTVKKEAPTKAPVGADLPGLAFSKIDVNAKPVYEPAGKPITQVNIDEDLNENDKPWRRPGTDVSDYFNYGFDEFTWALYASKQDALRSEYSQEKVALNNKKMMEDLNMMMMGGMPGMMPGATAMPGADGMPPEMQAMMQQMMASGMDPSQMDPSAMFAAMQGGQGAGAGAAGFGQGQNQQMGFGYDQAGGDSRNNRGGNFGRGRGGRRGGW